MNKNDELLQKMLNCGRNKGLIAIRAHKTLITEALSRGVPLTQIHRILKEEKLMPIEYPQFAVLVKKHIKLTPVTSKTHLPQDHTYDPSRKNEDDLI